MEEDRPAVRIAMDGPTWLVVETDMFGVQPADVLRWFTESDRLNQWWGEECTIDPVPGGRYEVRWPGMNWTMRGVVLIWDATQLVYSWTWDHEPNLPARAVIVRTEPTTGGTRLTISHGPYRPTSSSLPHEMEDRESHRDGWIFFLPKLHTAIAALM